MTDIALDIQQELLDHPRNMMVEYRPEPHTYHRVYDNGEREQWNGITSLIKKYAPFKKKKIMYGIINSSRPKYAHLNSIEDVEEEWNEARDHGSEIHDLLEHWGQTGEVTDDPCVQKATQFFMENQLYPIAFEHVLWCGELKRATPADIILVNKYGELVVSDYKTSKNIRKSFRVYKGEKKRMEYPLTHLPNTNFYSYSLQISFAIEWLNRYYNFDFPIANYGYIFHIRNGEFTPHKTLPMSNEIRKIYDYEKRVA